LHRHKHHPVLVPKDFTVEQEDWLRIRYQEIAGKFRARRALDEFEEFHKCDVKNPELKDDMRLAECLITNVFRRHERRLRQRAAEEAGEPLEPPVGRRRQRPDEEPRETRERPTDGQRTDDAKKWKGMIGGEEEEIGEGFHCPMFKKPKPDSDKGEQNGNSKRSNANCRRDIWVEDLHQNDVVKVLFTDPRRWLPGIVRGVNFGKGKATVMFSDGPFDIDNGDIFQLIDIA